MTGQCTSVGGRGCLCAFHVTERRKSTEYARRKRQRMLAEKLKTATRCPKRQGPYECGGPLRIGTDGNGRETVVCEWCERQRQGICRDCPKPIYGKRARRCTDCAYKAKRESELAWFERNRETKLVKYREYYHQPEVRAARNEYKRAWRKANPDKVRAQKKRYVERYRAEPASQYNRYHARYRKKHRMHYREIQNTRNAIVASHRAPPPACNVCGKPTGWTPVSKSHPGRPWSTCMKHAWPHQRKERRRVRRAAQKLAAANPRFGLPPKPVKVRRPPRIAARGPEFERICVGEGCDIVVTHRKKKCTKCQSRDLELARRELQKHRGRGRRTDLERVA